MSSEVVPKRMVHLISNECLEEVAPYAGEMPSSCSVSGPLHGGLTMSVMTFTVLGSTPSVPSVPLAVPSLSLPLLEI